MQHKGAKSLYATNIRKGDEKIKKSITDDNNIHDFSQKKVGY